MGASSDNVEVTTVRVEIDYAILQHFSQHLYSSPNKAVEELVTNGYDALAEEVHVFLPGESTSGSVIVWDDGDSMDIDGIRQLWWIARSPKDDGGQRIAQSERRGIKRAMIGKFGIGKLASYAVGKQMSHVCHRDNHYYKITVDYNEAPKLDEDSNGSARGFDVPLVELSEMGAKDLLKGYFSKAPDDFESLWNKESWTVAVIEDLRDDIKLTPGRLQWVLGNGMPSRPDFSVFVNSVRVRPKIEAGAFVTWDMSANEVQSRLKRDWEEAAKVGEVDRPIKFLQSGDVTVAECPELGEVSATIRLFENSIYKPNRDDAGRSEGFFVLVRERLLNPDDPKLFLPEPSYGAFRRMQIVIHADGLDGELLADRERLHRGSKSGVELAVIQQALYRVARAGIESKDNSESSESAFSLPMLGRESVRDPLTALIISNDDADLGTTDPSKTTMTAEGVGGRARIIEFDAVDNSINFNTDHPLFQLVEQIFGNTNKGRQARKLVELFALADLLLRGHLLDLGIDEELVEEIIAWRETLLRSMTEGYKGDPDLIIREVNTNSYKGSKEFERSLAKLFRLMGFSAQVDGSSGREDVLVVAPVGSEEKRFTVEAKGSKNPLPNDSVEISGASAHAAAVDASFSVVVAREFVGFARDRADGAEPATLQECRTQNPPVSIATVDTLVDLYNSVKLHQFPLTVISDLLAKIESPEAKAKSVANMQHPETLPVDWRGVLDEIWRLQHETASGAPVAVMQVQQSRSEWKTVDFDEFERTLIAIDAISGLIRVNIRQHSVNLYQHPDIVAERISLKFERSSS